MSHRLHLSVICVYKRSAHALLTTLLLKTTSFHINCNDIALKLR